MRSDESMPVDISQRARLHATRRRRRLRGVDITVECSEEAPVLEFNDYALAFHFVAECEDQFLAASKWHGELSSGGTEGEPMESYERDLLLYAHRDEPPFRTRVASLPVGMATLTVRFPAEIVYESELRRIRLQYAVAEKAGRSRKFSVFASETVFERSRIVILNLVLRPHSDTNESQLNEYDLIKLMKLWEGGEGRLAAGWGKEILFEMADGEPKPFEDAVRQIFGDWLPRRGTETERAQQSLVRPRGKRQDPVGAEPPLTYRVGTVELQVPETEWRHQLFRDIAMLREGGDAPDEVALNEIHTQRGRWDRLVAVGGILQGLLDFRAISNDELADVFAEVEIARESLVGFHKGTLLSLSGEDELDRDDERRSPIGVDPYLAIPNVVLLHNEQRLKAARRLELRLSRGQPRPSGSWNNRVDINQTANGLDVMQGLLAQNLPNVFHYRLERRLYDTGGHSRGFDDLETLIRLRREELASTLQRRERRRDRWTAILAIVSAIVVGVVAAVQNLLVQEVIQTLDWWIIVLFTGLLYLAFFQVRNRIF